MIRPIDANALEKEGWSLHRTVNVDSHTMEYQVKQIAEVPTIEPERKWETCFDCPLSNGCPKIRGCTNEQAEGYASDIPDDCPLSIEPERTGMWIPCSERLPGKHGEMYLVTISDGSVYSCALQWDANKKRWYLSFLNNGKILVDYIDDVIAWMPLPEPYCPNCGARMEQ